ncbi:MAG TPA: ABC transporter ATP-binding protein [Desulfobacteraceae bacterium]|nr:ABC transporter ATP-binding protein [Desulfobacteraceae bacterium]HPJ66254.1 ABC transporter ATP-binding protein [Desulfobacteraceae bacterium]HPQ27150.1 ABC transporter ATP-binding protein [Desulfobacteraceae bacterium]
MKNNLLLEIKDLHAWVGDKEILKGINLQIKKGEVHVIFGPNGSGKTTLLNVLMGFSGYKVSGKILLHGKDIINLPVDERARLGIGMSFQRPPAIKGVKLRNLITTSAMGKDDLMEDYAAKLNLTGFLDRDVNLGFSGGEIKRAELLQLILQDPEIIFLDEPESGVDLENIALIGEYTNILIGRHQEPEKGKTMKELYRQRRKSGLIITHTGHILNYLDVDIGHVLMEGVFACQANPGEMLHTITECGFEECFRCFRKEKEHGE